MFLTQWPGKNAVDWRGVLCLIAAAVCALAAPVHSQSFPTRQIRLITPFPPGGTTDILARLIAQKLTESFGSQVIVDNRAGAGGTLGLGLAARAEPDGHTIVIAHIGPLSMAPALYPKLAYDPVRDFAAISQVASVPNGFVVHPSLPVRTVKDLVAIARAKPKQVLYASAGSGSLAHLAAVNVELLAKIQLTHVPYKGGGPSVTALIGGETSMTITGLPQLRPHVKAGRLRLIAVGEPKRLSVLPDVPTIGETIPGYAVTQWQGILAPAGTPPEIIRRLHAEIVKAMHQPDVKKVLAADGVEVVANKPEEFAAHIKAEVAHWAPVIKASGARAE